MVVGLLEESEPDANKVVYSSGPITTTVVTTEALKLHDER